jgi:hypothetical protein
MTLNPLYSPLASMAWTRSRPRVRGHASARTHARVCADAAVLPPGNFKKDATVRPSHGRPRGHRPIVRPSVRPSVWKRPRDNRMPTPPELQLLYDCRTPPHKGQDEEPTQSSQAAAPAP